MEKVKLTNLGKNNICSVSPVENAGVNIVIDGNNNSVKIGKVTGNGVLNINIQANNSNISVANIWINNYLTIKMGQLFPNSLKYPHGCFIRVGENCTFEGTEIISCHSNVGVEIGDNCTFAFNTVVNHTDSHPIYDLNTNRIINKVQNNLLMGESCWICRNAMILKNCHLARNTIVGAGAIVANVVSEAYCIVAGNPAKIIKKNVISRRYDDEFFL